MNASKPRLKFATDLPATPALAPAELEKLGEEAARARAEMNARTAPMEVLTSEDLRIRLR